MKYYVVEYQAADVSSRWVSVGRFRAKSPAGAIAQFMKDVKLFPDLVAVRANLR